MVNRVSQKNQDIPMRTRVAPVPTFCQSAQWIWLPPHRLIASERSLTVRWSFCAKSSRQHLLLSTSTRMTNRHSIFPFRLPATFPRQAMNRKFQMFTIFSVLLTLFKVACFVVQWFIAGVRALKKNPTHLHNYLNTGVARGKKIYLNVVWLLPYIPLVLSISIYIHIGL